MNTKQVFLMTFPAESVGTEAGVEPDTGFFFKSNWEQHIGGLQSVYPAHWVTNLQ